MATDNQGCAPTFRGSHGSGFQDVGPPGRFCPALPGGGGFGRMCEAGRSGLAPNPLLLVDMATLA